MTFLIDNTQARRWASTSTEQISREACKASPSCVSMADTMAVWRRTLCWQTSGEWGNRAFPISIADLVESTGISERQVKRDLGLLTSWNIVARENSGGGRGRKPLLSFNLDSDSWAVPTLKKKVTSQTPVTIAKADYHDTHSSQMMAGAIPITMVKTDTQDIDYPIKGDMDCIKRVTCASKKDDGKDTHSLANLDRAKETYKKTYY